MSKKETKICPACKEKVKEEATRCPHCRQDLRNWFRRHPLLTFFLFFFFVFPVLVSETLLGNTPSKTSTTSSNLTPVKNETPVKEQKVDNIRGSYLDYDYLILNEKGDNRYAATFTPFLPHSDQIVTIMALEMIKQTYGNHKVTDLVPTLVERNGINVMRFTGVDYDFFFLVIKEDTGEIHSMIFWAE